MSWVASVARAEIVALVAYEHALWDVEFTRLHANELPWRVTGDYSRAGLNRYPEPQPRALVGCLAEYYGVPAEAILVGRGSDEAIDLLVRTFCRAGTDAVLICPPTFGMYAVAAEIQAARVIRVPLRESEGFTLDEVAILRQCSPEVKLVFLCSPNNPTGNLLAPDVILRIAAALAARAIVVVDEAYLEFAAAESLAQHLSKYPNLAILRTLSKAHGLAGARCGTLIADPEVISLVRKVIPPYAVSQLTLEVAMRLLAPEQLRAMRDRTAIIRAERERVAQALTRLRCVQRVWPSHTNFILAQFHDAAVAFARACAAQLLVREIRSHTGPTELLRITIGTAAQNERLLRALA